jgi:hypothetical protein
MNRLLISGILFFCCFHLQAQEEEDPTTKGAALTAFTGAFSHKVEK